VRPLTIWTRLLTIIGTLLTTGRLAHSQAAIFDSVRVVQATRSVCHRSQLYTVVEVALANQVGADHFIGDARRSCSPDSLATDFVVRNEWAEYFAGLRGHFLVLDSGTGSDVRGLVVFNLRTRRRTFAGPYVGLEPGVRGDTLGIWQPYELPQPRPGCPVVGGLGHGADSLVWLDLRAGTTRFAGRVRCATRQ
jgi:hypothetical protein